MPLSMLRISLAVLAVAFVPTAAMAQAVEKAAPPLYADLYTQLSGDLDDFGAAINAASTGPKKATSFAAQLTTANSNNGPTLLNAASFTQIQQEIGYLKSLGVQAVSVEVSFPMLNSTFLGSSYNQWVVFYGNVAAAVHAAGLKLIVESQSLIPSGLQSTAWAPQLQAFYPTMNFTQYVAARASTAAAVATTMKPDYFVLQEEPDTEANQSGQPSAGTVSGSTQMLSASQAAVAGLVPGMKVGAGFGSWIAAYQDFANSFTRTGCGSGKPCLTAPLDFLDLHLFPIIENAINCAPGVPCPAGVTNYWRNAMNIVATANAAGLRMTISQAWLRKVRDSEWNVLAGGGDIEEAREAFDFWAPLDQRFLGALHDLATYQGMYWIAPFNTQNFFAYLTWSTANSIVGDCGTGPSPCGTLTPAQIFANVQSARRTAEAAGTYSSTGQYWHDLIASDNSAPNAPGGLSGLWWNANESGWGINFTQRRNTVFAAWYTYDSAGNPKWYVATCTMASPWVANGTCSGALDEVSGPTFFGTAFDPAAVHVATAGSLQVAFQTTSSASMTYTVGAQTRTVAITRQPLASGTTPPPVDYTDLWWNPNESGWGIAITQQFDVLFLAWYVYDNTGKPVWYVATCAMNAAQNGCTGTLFRTSGPSLGPTFNPTQVQAFSAGTVSLTFPDANDAMLNYTVDGISASKAITRQVF